MSQLGPPGGNALPAQPQQTAGPPVNEELVKQAQTFLQNEDVKRTTLESRISFLEQRGLSKHEIAVALSRINQHHDAQRVYHDIHQSNLQHPHQHQHQLTPPPHVVHQHHQQNRFGNHSTQWYLGVATLVVGVGSLAKYAINKWTQRKVDDQKSAIEKHYEEKIKELERLHEERMKALKIKHSDEIRALESRQHKDLMTIVELIKNQSGNLKVALNVLHKAVQILNKLQNRGTIQSDKNTTLASAEEEEKKKDVVTKKGSRYTTTTYKTPQSKTKTIIMPSQSSTSTASNKKSTTNGYYSSSSAATATKNSSAKKESSPIDFSPLKAFAGSSTKWSKIDVEEKSEFDAFVEETSTLNGDDEDETDDELSIITPAAAASSPKGRKRRIDRKDEMRTSLEILTNNKDFDFSPTIKVLSTYLDNIISKQSEPKFQEIPMGNSIFKEKIQFVRGAQQFLGAVGFEAADGKLILKKHKTSPSDDGFESVRFGRKLLAEISA